MAESKNRFKKLGVFIGLVILAAGTTAVFVIQKNRPLPEEPESIRPVKTFVVSSDFVPAMRNYPGKIASESQVDLAFQVDGPLVELPVTKGMKVTHGQLLARLDDRDMQSGLQAAIADFDKAQTQLGRIQKALQAGAVSQTDLTNAQADFENAKAARDKAQKALQDTVLYAQFDGVVANTFVENFQNVQAKQPILSLQDINSLTIDVDVPEDRIISIDTKHDQAAPKSRFTAVFDSFPNSESEIVFKEVVLEADVLTQTYRVSFTLPSQTDFMILPGMTVTVREYPPSPPQSESRAFYVPLKAVPADGHGQYFVWKVSRQQAQPDLYKTIRQNVKTGQIIQDRIAVLDGLAEGDRVVSAGVHFLQEGQTVRLFESQ